MCMIFDGSDCFEALQALEANGELQLRVRKNLPGSQIDVVAKRGLRSDAGSRHLTLGALKYFADGALGPQSAAMLEPYEGTTSCGILLMDADEVFEQGKRAATLGWPLAIHAIGDAAVRAVLDGFERLRNYEKEQHLPPLSHRIEHVQLIAPPRPTTAQGVRYHCFCTAHTRYFGYEYCREILGRALRLCLRLCLTLAARCPPHFRFRCTGGICQPLLGAACGGNPPEEQW